LDILGVVAVNWTICTIAFILFNWHNVVHLAGVSQENELICSAVPIINEEIVTDGIEQAVIWIVDGTITRRCITSSFRRNKYWLDNTFPLVANMISREQFIT